MRLTTPSPPTQEEMLYSVNLNDSHNTDSKSSRTINGELCTIRPLELRIIRYDQDTEVYLIEYDDHGREIIDTLHDDVQGAMEQANFDWGVKESDWVPVGDK